MSAWLSQAYTDNVGWDLLAELVDASPRMAGSDGESKAAAIVRDAFEEAGTRDVRREPFDIVGWTRGSSVVSHIDSDREYDCIALPRSPDGAGEGRLVDVGYGRPEDFADADTEGNVVMAAANVPEHYNRFIHRREKYYYAVENGAAAFLFRNHIEGQLPPTGSIGTEADPIGEIPAVGVSKEVGAELARRYEGKSLRVDVEVEIGDATSQNVHAALGPDTDEEVLVTSHVDAHDIAAGAMDNGAGTAIVVELANTLAAREDELETKVHFIAFGAEEVGLKGSEYYADANDLSSVKAVVNNDGTARARDLKIITHGFDAFERVADEISDVYHAPVETLPTLNPHSDHWPFVKRGIPGCQTKSATGARDRGWGHTHADTLDKVDSRDIRHHAILLAEAVVRIAATDAQVNRRPTAGIAEQLEAENKAVGMRVIGDWPFDDR